MRNQILFLKEPRAKFLVKLKIFKKYINKSGGIEENGKQIERGMSRETSANPDESSIVFA